MNLYIIDGKKICDWDSFHDVFQQTFKFTSYYGRNMNAWIDCMSDLSSSEINVIQINNIEYLKKNNKEIFDEIIECSAFVNWRYTSRGAEPVLSFSFYK